jgi:hypothetical protein
LNRTAGAIDPFGLLPVVSKLFGARRKTAVQPGATCSMVSPRSVVPSGRKRKILSALAKPLGFSQGTGRQAGAMRALQYGANTDRL